MSEDTQKEQISAEELEKLNKDIDDTTKKLVSDETAAQIQEAKEEAKKEAEKEFAINQRIKELEDEKAKLEEQRIAKEKEAAEQLTALKSKVDELTSSKAVVQGDSPFKEESQTAPSEISEEVADDIERQSFEMFWEESRKPQYDK